MFPSGSGFTPGAPRKGAAIALEALDEWKIQEIGYNGVEKYLKPESFSDHVGKLARQVDWKEVVGSDSTYDDPAVVQEPMEENDHPIPAEDRTVPDAGPWHTVAKNLHESLQQLNVLLDDLAILGKTNYMAPLTILDPVHSDPQPLDKVQTDSKSIQWVWKRKALTEAASVLEKAAERYSKSNQSSETLDNFFLELKKMREYWRIRKTGDHIYGDLGYHIFGSKYNSRELFDITRRSTPQLYFERGLGLYPNNIPLDKSVAIQSVLQVSVPRDLTRRSTLSLSIVRDHPSTLDLFADLQDANYEWMKIDPKKIENIHWSNALKWAQDTLICRDTFETLCSESVRMRFRRSTIRDGVLLVALYDDLLLRIELKYYPFVDGEFEADGDSYLNRSLRQMVVAKECTRWIRPQLYVSLPTTQLSEDLDIRGPKAFTQKQIDAVAYKPQYLLEQIIQVSSHYSLVKLCVETLLEFILDNRDPQIHWRFMRCTPLNSQMMVIVTSRNYDHMVGKMTYYLQITDEKITLVTKEGHPIECYRDKNMLINALRIMIANYSLNSVYSLGRSWWFMLLHANMNALDDNKEPAPSLFMTSYCAVWQVLVQFCYGKNPIIKIRKFVANPSSNPEEDEFHVLNYNRIPGSTLIKKMDNVFAMMWDPKTDPSLDRPSAI